MALLNAIMNMSTSSILTTSNIFTTTNGGGIDAPLPLYVGYIGIILAAVFFGSNFIPIKKYETGDGLFFQLILCISIWFSSVILYAIRGFPRFWPLSMLGGFLWCTGNIMAVPIIQCIGLAMGILIWNMSNMLMGWASGRFGWFGLTAEVPDNTAMNYCGVASCFVGACIVALIKPHIVEPDDHSSPSTAAVNDESERDPLLPPSSGDTPVVSVKRESYDSMNRKAHSSSYTDSDEVLDDSHGDVNSMHHRLGPQMRKIVGIVMALISGLLYGANFAPVIYVKNNYPQWYGNCTHDPCIEHVSSKDIDYVFSHFTGIMVTSLIYFTIYCVYKKNKPVVYPKVILPAIISGVMWAIADIGFFLANEVLDESISFPMINAGPNIIASLWGVFLFREIRGKRNLLTLMLAFIFILGGCVLCGLSK